ncbi:hypothetical protein [Rufibacter tibetensis]|uniref:Uncharacterized protein n=1 Tax=Rufibacter tibetensis TaxID=512763 RepID=A0A0P0C650_9BACT|nr:hypothetical protein [Rufibacter tibetensis]ALJ00456.1 hypothetical protein DC20_17630 [Rufibacter tibetensis]
MENEQPHDAEKVYLSAIEKMKSFISNLNNPLLYRAMLVTELKLLFYELASFYATKMQFDSLHAFTEKNTPALKSWPVELEMISQSGLNPN